MPKQWIFTTLYILLIYAVIHGIIIYARNHPIEDARPASSVLPGEAGESSSFPGDK